LQLGFIKEREGYMVMLEEHMPTIENVLSPFLKEREDVAKVVKLKDQIKDFDKLVETAHESFV
jgi:GTP-binding protein EngB required for normal cell division